MLDRWVVAFCTRNSPAIMSIYAPDVVAYDMTPPLRFRGIDAYRKDYEDYFDAYDGPVDVELRDVAVVAGKDVAVAFGLEQFKGKLKSGDVTDFWARFTSAFRKIDRKWLDVHDHDSVPIDFATGKASLDLKP